jgi:restriction system protein
MANNKDMWMVRAGEDAFLFDDFRNKDAVVIGWNDIGDLSNVSTPEQIKKIYREKRPEATNGNVNINAGQISRFRFDFKKGDYVVTYNPQDRKYLVGEIISDYKYDPKIAKYYHARQVKWLGEVLRDKLLTSTRNTLGAISTVFNLGDDAKADVLRVLEGGGTQVAEDAEQEKAELTTIKEDVALKAQEFIKDKLSALDWDEMQELIAGLLRGMGYKTIVSPKGADRGRDIQASPDGLGLEEPRIVVEVKHRSGQMGSKDVRSFITGVGHGNKGLYVSTGGFSKDAKYEAERSTTPITLIDIDMLVGLLIQYYDNLDMDTRSLIPLVKIYWPA